MSADFSWGAAWDDYASRIHTAEATVTRLRAERDKLVHDLLVACAHDGKRDGRVGLPIIAAIVCGLPIPWEHIGDDVHQCENASPHVPPRGCVKFAAWAPERKTGGVTS